MTAEIIEFPDRERQDPLVSSVARLEQIVREVEGLAVEQPAEGLAHLLTVMERLGDRLLDVAHHVLDEDGKLRAESAFTSLSDKIAETRDAFVAFGGPKHP
ncbi:hypothetical protein [Bradyrhizobium sp. 21]|uniref:hypothetical protein n=1 Tax=Bradyrhizobium sp. 21 TaxID=2782666 RepID=UPI001FF85C4C|nr:hypothetical protein [Bradyrhizobium sp. 21]MCK1385671.1 hypothetical protein [Bradyrhizobium sp. 21]